MNSIVRSIKEVPTHAALVVFSAAVLFPFCWIAAAAFKNQIALITGALTFTPTLSNFQELLFSKTSAYLHNFLNSAIVASASTILVLTIATLAAHTVVRKKAPGWLIGGILAWAVVFEMVPPITMAGPWYIIFRSIGLENTLLGIVLAHTTLNLPLALWLICVSIREVPLEIEEAAKIDGCSERQLLTRIVLPLIKPGLSAAGILVFLFSWNEFVVALTLSDKNTATVPVAIAKYAQEYEIQYTQMAAGALLSTAPAVLLLLFCQRHIVRGLTAGALK